MRIISGTARGTRLYTLEGNQTRPTLDRVRESLFNILQNDIKESNFLDLFGGSGAVGLEAASRGAKKVVICDSEKQAINIINRNIEKTHLKDKVIVYNLDYESLLKELIDEQYDLIYIDPPYNSNYAINALKLIIKNKLANDNTKIMIETDDTEKILVQIKDIKINLYDKRKYGRAEILFFSIK